MRFCNNEDVKVYESIGNDLADLLEDAVEHIRGHDGYANVHVSSDEYADYTLTLYLHG